MEEFNVYEGIMEGLKEAAAYRKGEASHCRVTVREIPVPQYKASDVVKTRKSLNLSQRAFAAALGVSTRTVEAWEAGKNEPSGAARHLLFLFDRDHTLVDYLIAR